MSNRAQNLDLEKGTLKDFELEQEMKLEIKKLENELSEMGGLAGYQIASLKGGASDKGFSGCGKWLLKTLKKFKVIQAPSSGLKSRLKMLDVGAIGEVYENEKHLMDVESIDLHSQSPLVKEQDFFSRPIPSNNTDKFNVIGLSLVINFIPDPLKRGEMLKLSRARLLPSGFLFIVLPLP